MRRSAAEIGDDFLVRWHLDNGPPKDIQVLQGNWQWLLRDRKPKTMYSEDVFVLLLARVLKRPFVVSMKTANLGKTGRDVVLPCILGGRWPD